MLGARYSTVKRLYLSENAEGADQILVGAFGDCLLWRRAQPWCSPSCPSGDGSGWRSTPVWLSCSSWLSM
jgi:hypothetical protein